MGLSQLAKVLEEYSANSEQAFEQLLKICGPVVFRIVRRRLGRRSPRFDSADIAQAVWASFFGERIDVRKFETPEDLVKYLAAIASNKVRKAQRDNFGIQKRSADREADVDAMDANLTSQNVSSPSQRAIGDETWERLLAETPPSQQRILYLRLDGKTQEEIAEILGISSRTVRRLLARLKERIDL
jgi:RNA polymerase sigma factor (sigma-70 family)